MIVIDRIAEYTLSIERSGTSNARMLEGGVVLRYPHGVKPGRLVDGRWWWYTPKATRHIFCVRCVTRAEFRRPFGGSRPVICDHGRTRVQGGGPPPLEGSPNGNDARRRKLITKSWVCHNP